MKIQYIRQEALFTDVKRLVIEPHLTNSQDKCDTYPYVMSECARIVVGKISQLCYIISISSFMYKHTLILNLLSRTDY